MFRNENFGTCFFASMLIFFQLSLGEFNTYVRGRNIFFFDTYVIGRCYTRLGVINIMWPLIVYDVWLFAIITYLPHAVYNSCKNAMGIGIRLRREISSIYFTPTITTGSSVSISPCLPNPCNPNYCHKNNNNNN